MVFRAGRHVLIVAACATAAVTACGCSSKVRVAPVATNLGLVSTPTAAEPSRSNLPPTSPSLIVSASVLPSATAPSSTPQPPATAEPSTEPPPSATPSDGDGFSSPTPCPVAAPQIFVEGTSAETEPDGTIVFRYKTAQRLCGGPDDVQYVTTGTTPKEAKVDPAASVFMLSPDGSPQTRQIPAGALPTAMGINEGAPYYALTFDANGTITRVEQYFHP